MKNTFNFLIRVYCPKRQGRSIPFRFLIKGHIFPLFVFLLSLVLTEQTFGQAGFCGFDQALQKSLEDNPGLKKTMEENEKRLQAFVKKYTKNPNNLQKSGGTGTVYTIPVVFHVIHLGEPEGTNSNIDSTLLDQTLQFLNEDFRDTVHNDTEIEFCLAQRDPDGNPSTGINRVNGYGVGGYESRGIDYSGGNEFEIKGLSRWPNTDYINIWIVWDIEAGNNNIIGYATFPGGSFGRDGIVLRADRVGDPDYSGVISHEAGHFFNLYHTFEGDSTNTCPPNTNCSTQGDFVCDTRPIYSR